MMRIKSGLFCALSMSLAFAFACADSGTGGGDDGTGGTTNGPVCGDGTCAAAEANSCPTDCGTGGGNQNQPVCGNGQCETTKGETASSCFSDCGNGNNGSGSGSGSSATFDCNDQNTQFACFACLLDPTSCTPPYDATSCQQCFGGGLGSGSGSGSGACNFNGTCDSGEDANNCPFDCP